jgi:hypothetical protein
MQQLSLRFWHVWYYFWIMKIVDCLHLCSHLVIGGRKCVVRNVQNFQSSYWYADIVCRYYLLILTADVFLVLQWNNKYCDSRVLQLACFRVTLVSHTVLKHMFAIVFIVLLQFGQLLRLTSELLGRYVVCVIVYWVFSYFPNWCTCSLVTRIIGCC